MLFTSAQRRENALKAIHFERPDYIPMQIVINGACYDQYPVEALFDLMESHPLLFPEFVRPGKAFVYEHTPITRKDPPFVDDFGCTWMTAMDGLVGTVVKHPLDDWQKWDTYRFPDPSTCMGIGPIDWTSERKRIAELKAKGALTWEGLRHGHTFLQLCDIRGYENALIDMADDEPQLAVLLDRLTEFNTYIIQQYLDMDVDIVSYAEDLGMQLGPMLSPQNFREYILPCYKRMMKPAKEKGTNIHMHSDGDIRTLAPMLLECGVQILNLQDLVNGLDWIQTNLKGKVCIDLDIDRQKITPYGTPEDIDRLVRKEVEMIGSREGGMMMIYGLYPGVPLENAKALFDAMEKYAFYYNG